MATTKAATKAPQQMTHDRAREVLERAYALMNEHDLAHIPAIFTEDVVFVDDAYPETVRGHDGMRRFLGGIWRAFPDFRFALAQGPYLSEEGGVAAHVRVTGTMTGPLDPPGFAPSGKRLDTEYAGFYELEGDRVRRARIILNMQAAAVQLGALPPPGSRGEKVAVVAQRLQTKVRARLGR